MGKVKKAVINVSAGDSSDSGVEGFDNPTIEKSLLFKKVNKCILCNKEFKRKDDYERHIFAHTGEKKFSCHYESCGKEYTNSSHLKRHINSAHEKKAELGSVKCLQPNCKQLFTNSSNMTRHYNVLHIQGKRYECEHCQEKFMRKDQLKRHMFSHTGQYPHNCEQCKKGFANLKNYNKHLITHKLESQKIHKCPDCPEEFEKWSTMVAHRRIIHTLKFICVVCQGKFHSKTNLKVHEKIHSESREIFECDRENCPKYYYDKKNLQSHIKSKHEGKKFNCEIEGCDRQLSTKQKLILHHKMHKDSSSIKKTNEENHKRPKKPRAKRFDAGHQKHSTISKLLGVNLEPNIDEMLKESRGRNIQVDISMIESSAQEDEMTDTDEVHKKREVWKNVEEC